MRHLPAWGMPGDRVFFRSVLSAWFSFAQIEQPIFGVFLNVTFFFCDIMLSKGAFPICLNLPFCSQLHLLRFGHARRFFRVPL